MNKTATTQSDKRASLLPANRDILQRKCACSNHTIAGGECADCAQKKMGLQRKLTIGASNNPLEQEADRIADQVMASPDHGVASGTPVKIQRFTGNPSSQETKVPPSVEHILASSGQPLESGLREEMEGRFGYDFSRVRIHTGGAAEQSAREVNANAYTVGDNIVFGAGQFTPETHKGRRLISHELAHVTQQIGPSLLYREEYIHDAIIMPRARANTRLLMAYLDVAIPSEVRTDLAMHLFHFLPALAEILDEYLNETNIHEIVNPTSVSHPSSYDDRIIPIRARNALWDYYKARWESPNRAVRRGWIESGQRNAGPYLRPATLRRYTGRYYEQINDLVQSLIRDRSHALYQRGPYIALNQGDQVTDQPYYGVDERVEISSDSPRERRSRPRRSGRRGRRETPALPEVTDDEMALPGRRSRQGWAYFGTGSIGICNRLSAEKIAAYERFDLPDLALLTRVFIRTASSREGYISAINTWDKVILTWGTGFGYPRINQYIWPVLDVSIRNYLIEAAPTFFTTDGIVRNASLLEANRRNPRMISALIYVAENEPYATHVFNAQLYGFMTGTGGLTDLPYEDVVLPEGYTPRHAVAQQYYVSDASWAYFFTRLNHYTSYWQNPRDGTAAIERSGGSDSAKALIISHCIHILTNNMLAASVRREVDTDGRVRIKQDNPFNRSYVNRWINRMVDFNVQDNEERGFSEALGEATAIIPAFSNAHYPYFTPSAMEEIPSGNMVGFDGEQAYNLGVYRGSLEVAPHRRRSPRGARAHPSNLLSADQ